MDNKRKYKNDFKELTKQDKMPISSVEDLMKKNIEEYKNDLLRCTEEMLMETVDERDLIAKKKISGVTKELDLKILEKEKLNLR